jgi:hypothetical protein
MMRGGALWLGAVGLLPVMAAPPAIATARTSAVTSPATTSPVSTPPGTTAPVTPADARAVVCLNPARRSQLVEAAEALHLAGKGAPAGSLVARDGQVLTVEDWSSRQPADFDRACRALVGALGAVSAPAPSYPPDRYWFERVLPLLPSFLSSFFGAAFGALVAAATGLLKRRWQLGEQVRLSGLAFCSELDELLLVVMQNPDERRPNIAATHRARNEALAALERLIQRHPDWSRPKDLRALLLGPLGPGLSFDWGSREGDRPRVDGLRAQLDHARSEFVAVGEGAARVWGPPKDGPGAAP